MASGGLRSLVLIGMPGAGKSTVGVVLAKRLGLDFVDTDLLIQHRERRRLQEILDSNGYLALRRCEELAILELKPPPSVIATGGSAVYSESAMAHLRSLGPVVFLDAALATVKRRINDADTRGIAKAPGQTFEQLFEERNTLYRQWAQLTVVIDELGVESVVEKILDRLAAYVFYQ
jgi:shikimate kinase